MLDDPRVWYLLNTLTELSGFKFVAYKSRGYPHPYRIVEFVSDNEKYFEYDLKVDTIRRLIRNLDPYSPCTHIHHAWYDVELCNDEEVRKLLNSLIKWDA
jgi:hypothetical protein